MKESSHLPDPTTHRKGMEMLFFLAVSAGGIYAMGSGLQGVFDTRRGINLAWLALVGLAFLLLSAQMGRVHDAWPRRMSHDASAKHQAGVAIGEPAEVTSLEADSHRSAHR